MRLIEFEFLKLLRNKKTIFIVLSCLLFSALFIVYNHYRHNRYIEDMIQDLKTDNIIANQRVEYLMKFKSLNETQKEELEYWGPEAVITSFLKTYYSSPILFDWKDILEQSNKRNTNLIIGYQNKHIYVYSQSVESKIKDLENEVLLNNYLLEHNIEPLLSPFYPSAFNLIYLLNSKEMMLIIIILFVVSIIDIFSSEIESGSYKITYTSPYSRIQILQTKILISCIFVSFLYILTHILIFILSSIVTGVGSPEYPILVNTLGEFEIIPVFQFIQTSLLYYWVQLIFFVFLSSFLFIVFKDSTSIISILSGIFLMTYLIVSYRAQSFINYLPFGSFDFVTILQNFGFNKISFFSVLSVSYSGIIYLINRILIKRISFTGGM
ncbi:MAG: ABC transporter permease subunit [Erysipelotrichaceae bacterium]